MLRTVLITRDVSVIAEWGSHSVKAFSASLSVSPGRRQGVQEELGQLSPPDPRDIPGHPMSCSVYKAGGKRKKGKHSE